MTKQLLIYERAVPVSVRAHGDVSVKVGTDYSFVKAVNSVPVLAAEFEASSVEYAIVFAGEPGGIMPAVMLGLRDAENVNVDAGGHWLGKYVPAFIRRYPFVFSYNEGDDTFSLFVDESYAGVNREGLGERLFDSSGERTQYLKGVLGFLQAYQAQYNATRAFVQELENENLLDPMEAQFTLKNGLHMKLGGFKTVNRDRLRQLSSEKLTQFARSGQLDLIYAHLSSLRNFTPTAERVSQLTGETASDLASEAPLQKNDRVAEPV